ncbi:MAG TPA: hypothetical protein VK357_07720, partial [Rubrobacteraceae bacterium]|nr:hypothetical protein [Rubrobacteraceae bacterium]
MLIQHGRDAVLGAPLTFALELVVLYAAGSYAMGRLAELSGYRGGSALGRAVFYLLVFPGVILHEGAHYLACLLTGTKVFRFAPFSPRRSADGRRVLGYVRHERRSLPIQAIIGLAPILVNPLGLLLVTALLTPLTLAEIVKPGFGLVEENLLAGGIITSDPLLATIWAYLSLSFAVGSVPSREDLASLPAVLLLLCAGVILISLGGEN